MTERNSKTTDGDVLLFGIVMGIWAVAALIGALTQVGSLTELARQYMAATGIIKPLHTLVDFYSHIKGMEYLICVAFFVAFPLFYTYVNKEKKGAAQKS
ncbi:MAG: hypothetical protein GQ559_00860 [Desulfobulbaceae bacterium]|nr:hypothetical protein [Desulfobulbaceae bacterium]